MIKCITLILFMLWTGVSIYAQCPGTPLTLSNQNQVNNFPTNYPGCTVMDVSLTIQGNNITNLNGLSGLESITKSLFILNNPSLTSLSGLSNLSNIGVELTLDNNDALTNLNGLENLPFIGGTLTITGNAVLNSLSALSGVEYVNGSLLISYNPQLTNLNGLENVGFTGRFLQISNNNGLTALNSLNNLTEVGNNAATIGRYLSIGSNPNLTTLNGLNSLESIGTDFEITGNGNLADLNAFASLSSVGGEFAITNNPDLTNLDDFATTFSIEGNLIIASNMSLSDCAALGICAYLDEPQGTISITSNAVGCNNVAQVETACAAAPVELTFFRGEYEVESVALSWQTASEQNNAFFQVEHSTNGSVFQPLGIVPGSGNSTTSSDYNFRHQHPAEGLNYYRLKQVDYDGKFEYSPMISVRASGIDRSVFPNPVDDVLFVKGDAAETIVSIRDAAGRTVLEKINAGDGPIDFSHQPSGIYFVEIQTNNRLVTKKIYKASRVE